MPTLEDQQRRLSINVINYDLEKMWGASPLIAELRKRIAPFMPESKLYDPQDLEHQVLFRLTTYDPKDITDEVIKFVVEEQYHLIQHRLAKLGFDREYLFRGLTGKYQDLNVNDRLELCWQNQQLVAKNDRRSFNVEFRVVHDERIISLFSSELHYIHRDRPRGETFGFYFAGDEIPWAIETTEPSVIAKEYKREALLANSIDPNKAIELTRFYTLPGAPTNAISLMDGLVSQYYKPKGIEALFTTAMPMYSKSKSTTIGGGINKPLLVKDLRHKFMPVKVNDKIYYRHITTVPEDHKEIEVIKTHPNFPTMLVVEVFRMINQAGLVPVPALQDGTKVIYVAQRDGSHTEQEIKLPIKDIAETLQKIRGFAKYSRTVYMRDVIYGRDEDKKKIRLRLEDNFGFQTIYATHKYKVAAEEGVKKEIEETVYKGNSMKEALAAIANQGKFKEENSYEKIRVLFMHQETEITIDIYPYGSWLEIEGKPEKIHQIASELGYTKKDYHFESADDLYLNWIKEHNLPEMWDVRFGLNGKK